MAEIEITTSGEVKLAGDMVGQITWTRPFVEVEVAGVFYIGDDDWGDPFECGGCIERDSLLRQAKKSCDEINAIGAEAQIRIGASGHDDDELNILIRKIREVSDGLEFET
jgi:hypothetical protein